MPQFKPALRNLFLAFSFTVSFTYSIPAAATPLLFTFTGGISGSFNLDSSPVVALESPSAYFFTNYSKGIGSFSNPNNTLGRNIVFTTTDYRNNNEQLDIVAYILSPVGQIGLDGPQIFGGTTASPNFSPGNFALTVVSGSTIGTPGAAVNLTISSPGAPGRELATGWLAALAAIAGLALTRHRIRFRALRSDG